MSEFVIARSALVLSTTPPIPREYGNRNRVFQTIDFLKDAGFAVSLLLYPFDEEWSRGIPPYYKELAEQFEYFSVIPNTKELHRGAAAYHHTIDEWWDEAIGHQLAWLLKRKRFDILFVNYTFLSRAFEFASKSVLRVLDTHDLFTNRREIFEQHGVSAEFFYTNAQQEKIAFDRADAVIAIKNSEAEFIRTLTNKHVFVLPYWDNNPIFRPSPRTDMRRVFSHEVPLRVGFIGAQNSVNIVNMQRFLFTFDRYVRLYNLPVEVVVAGNVCRHLHPDYSFLTKLGRIARIQEFYEAVDVVIAPFEFSTGIKIKVGEALVLQLPVISTANAFDGFRSFHSTQIEASVATLCQSLAALATNELSFGELTLAARRAGTSALRAQEKGFSDLKAWIKSRMQRILVITDRPFWNRSTYLDELIAQTVEYVSHIAPTVVASLSHESFNPEQIYAGVDYVSLKNDDSLSDLLMQISATSSVCGAILFGEHDWCQRASAHSAILGDNCWTGHLQAMDGNAVFEFRRDGELAKPIVVSPLRYLPLLSRSNLSNSHVVLLAPPLLSEWEHTVTEYIDKICTCLNLTFTTIKVPAHGECNQEFYRELQDSNAGRMIILGSDATSRLFVVHMAQYRAVAVLLVGENFACPQSLSSGGLPSVTQSIVDFLHGGVTAHSSMGPNSGWSTIWSLLESGREP